MPVEHDVAIVGYGPVGECLAILLAEHGWRVGVFEKQPFPYPLPRAVHFDDECARILQAAGIAEEIVGASEAADFYEWRNAAGETLLRFASQAAGACGWPEANMFAQPEIERLLDARARSFACVDVQRGKEAVALEEDEEGVALTVVGSDGQRSQTRARFVVGCDGANSFVRQHLGATVTDLGFFFDWLIVDIVPHTPKLWSPLNVQICDPARPTTLVSGGPGRRRWEFMRLPGESLEELNQESTAWRLLEPWGVTAENATLERHAVYRFQARWADTWRKGRLLIAGDAAHQMPPFAGQGMCAGLRDAANLAWKLDLILAGKAPADLLDTYASERVPHVDAMINFSMALGRVICVADPTEAEMRDKSMIAAHQAGEATTSPPAVAIGPGITRRGDPLGGQRFLQGRVQQGQRSGRFDDLVGRGWVLLSCQTDPAALLDDDIAAFFRSIGGVTVRIGGGAVRDLDGVYEKWLAQAGVASVLQRPDFYLFGAAPEAGDTNALVSDLRQALTQPPRG